MTYEGQQIGFYHAENFQDYIPYEGQTFNSDEDAYHFYCLFAKKYGFSVRRGHVYRHGKKSEEDSLDIYKREFVCHRAEVRFLPANRDIPINDQNQILLLTKAGATVNLMMRVLELEKGIDPGHLPYLEKDIRNFIHLNSSIGKENDAAEVLKLCKHDDFQYDFTLDESNKLEHIIWAFGDSVRAYEAFGDVVVFDTTY
ncbi:hypothetical protein Lal_00023809 [Lupinus albus]|nr:hypothetical protein Lal_00023809 [Lupinus albus]